MRILIFCVELKLQRDMLKFRYVRPRILLKSINTVSFLISTKKSKPLSTVPGNLKGSIPQKIDWRVTDWISLYRHRSRKKAVLRIQRIHMFLGPQDPDPLVRCMDLDPDQDPLVRCMDLDPIRIQNWIRILLSSSKNSKKNLDSYCFVTFFGQFIFEK